MNPTDNIRDHLKHLACVLALGVGLGAGSAQGQAILEVGGADTIDDETLATNAVPAAGATWTTDGGEGIVESRLISPAASVPTTGQVTLTFDHRYNFETGWDGGAVFVSINGAEATYVPLAAFSANGYVGDTTADGSAAWSGGEDVFYGQSTGYATPTLIQSVADLGTLTAGDTVSVEFRGGWDDASVEAPPNWEISTVQLTDAAATDFLDVDFVAAGESGFTVTDIGTVAGPWTYLKPVSIFEIDADTLTADRYAPSTPGSVIDLNDAALAVEVLTGTLNAGETFTLFDLSGGTTLTGTYSSLTLPPGTWDVSQLPVDGTITLQLLPPLLTPGADFELIAGDDTDADQWWEDLVPGNPSGLGLLLDDSPAVTRVATSTGTQLTHAYDFPGGGAINNEAGALLVDSDSTIARSFQDGPAGDWTNQNVTIEIWLKPDSLTPVTETNTNGQIVFEDGGGTGFGFFVSNNELQLRKAPGGGIVAYDLSTDPSGLLLGGATSEFFQAVGTYDVAAGAMELFINGTSIGTATPAGGDWSGGDDAAFGTRGAANVGGIGSGQSSTEAFDGQIALIRMYRDQILTPAEVANNFADLSGPDEAPPVIASLTPPNNTSDFFVGFNLVATFNEDIALKSGGTITIRNLDTVSDTVITIPDARLTSPNGNDLLIDPATDLAFGTNYAILISADAIEDQAAPPNAFGGILNDTTWSFTTLPVDTTAPVITDLSPPDDDSTVLPGSDLVVTFDEDITAGTGNVLVKNLTDPGTTTIDITDASQVSIAGNVLTVKPTDNLAAGADIAVQIENGAVENLTGIAFPGITDDVTWNFSTLSGTTMTATSNWVGGTWSNGEPAVGLDAVIAEGVTGTAVNSVSPWSGSLTLEAGSLLIVQSTVNPNPADIAIDGATSYTLSDGARIRDNFKTYTFGADFAISGVAGMDASGPNSGWNQGRTFNGVISGDGTWTTKGYNHMGYNYTVANTFTGGYVVDSGDRHGVEFSAAGAAGTGDVTVLGRETDGRSGVIILGADDAFDPSAKLTLNGMGWADSTGGFGPYASGPWVETSVRIAMQGFNATVSELYIDDVQQDAGDYTETDGDWITGVGTLTVLNGPSNDYTDWATLYPEADLTDPNADLDGDSLSNNDERLFGLDPTDPASQDPYVVPFDAAAGTLSFTRRDDALTGLFSGVETSTDLIMWTEDGGAELTPGAPDADAIETVAVTLSAGLLSAPKLFVRVVQDDGTLFSENFEDDNGGFTNVNLGTGTDWAWGAPDSSDQGGGGVSSGNGGSTNCWATNLTGAYAAGTDASLRSDLIDLTGVTGANLSFAVSIDADTGHTYEVNVIDDTGAVIANVIPATDDADAAGSEWETVGPTAIPAAALGQAVRLEWRFTGNGANTFNGVYIDDITISQAMP